MKRIILFAILMLLPLIAIRLYADENQQPPAEFEVPLRKADSGSLVRSLDYRGIKCFYSGVTSSIQTLSTESLGIVELVITNMYTGEIYYDSFDSSSVSHHLTQISGSSGYYEVCYTTEEGVEYLGYFILE